MPRLETPRLQMTVFQMGVTVASGHRSLLVFLNGRIKVAKTKKGYNGYKLILVTYGPQSRTKNVESKKCITLTPPRAMVFQCVEF